jgi:hypothetical protein
MQISYKALALSLVLGVCLANPLPSSSGLRAGQGHAGSFVPDARAFEQLVHQLRATTEVLGDASSNLALAAMCGGQQLNMGTGNGSLASAKDEGRGRRDSGFSHAAPNKFLPRVVVMAEKADGSVDHIEISDTNEMKAETTLIVSSDTSSIAIHGANTDDNNAEKIFKTDNGGNMFGRMMVQDNADAARPVGGFQLPTAAGNDDWATFATLWFTSDISTPSTGTMYPALGRTDGAQVVYTQNKLSDVTIAHDGITVDHVIYTNTTIDCTGALQLRVEVSAPTTAGHEVKLMITNSYDDVINDSNGVHSQLSGYNFFIFDIGGTGNFKISVVGGADEDPGAYEATTVRVWTVRS